MCEYCYNLYMYLKILFKCKYFITPIRILLFIILIAPTVSSSWLIVENKIIIEKNDNLWDISHTLYGKGWEYRKLWDTKEPNSLSDNPNLIYPGMVFRLEDRIIPISTNGGCSHSTYKNENIYWLFSSSAQSVAVFIALLVAGFAIVISVIQSLEDKDETLYEILHSLKIKYHHFLSILGVITGLAIVFSLYSIYLNNNESVYNNAVYITTIILTTSAIMGGIIFMIYILNPKIYKNIASQMYNKERKKIGYKGNTVLGMEFLQKFIELERVLRSIIMKFNLDTKFKVYDKRRISFKALSDILLYDNIINTNTHDSLTNISKIRNLVAHGEIEVVEENYLIDVNNLIKSLQNLLTSVLDEPG